MQDAALSSLMDAAMLFFNSPAPLYWPLGIGLVGLIITINVTRRYAKQHNALSQAKTQSGQLQSQVQTLNEQFTRASNALASAQAINASVREQRDELKAESTRLQQSLNTTLSELKRNETLLESETKRLHEQEENFKTVVKHSEQSFKVLSESILNERAEALSKSSKDGLSALLNPLKTQLQEFQTRVNQVHSESVQGQSRLRSELDFVKQMGMQLKEEASNLTNALKGDSQKRGAWGEAQLLRTLEVSGLVEKEHFERQTSHKDEHGQRKATDFLIKLPDNKCLIIDSKVSLNAYEAAVNGAEEDFERKIKIHTLAVRNHIKDLAGKEYTNIPSAHSPDFVLMFMPIEPAYMDTVRYDPDIHQFGLERNVVLVTHGTLLPILRVVANLWMMDRSNKETRALGNLANDVFNGVVRVSERLAKVGSTLQTASNQYNETVTALSGGQGLQKKVERFKTLSAKANKAMPDLTTPHLDFDHDKLEFERLPLNEETSDEDR